MTRALCNQKVQNCMVVVSKSSLPTLNNRLNISKPNESSELSYFPRDSDEAHVLQIPIFDASLLTPVFASQVVEEVLAVRNARSASSIFLETREIGMRVLDCVLHLNPK
ncbi:hypothetical protein Hypma_001322 [Hypsizygus marmoreus]|uniref:Uncharacterized protein n=1 Tax=Hypsizygus marmoreus TaxID=39966 RepID=A0A369K953_HYPMA|nr:hypothetical protein Hypma_001322 [Hypsizygus marmoreus]